jgi:nitroreductase
MADLLTAIEQRRSRRKYIPKALDQYAAETLQGFITDHGSRENLKMQLVVNNRAAFKGFRKSYGMFSGVLNYIALIADKDDTISLEKLGYYGEMLVLQATSLGLGTCWVGGTFDRNSCPVALDKGESVVCAITVGEATQELSAKEKLIRWGTHRKSKTIEQMYTSDVPVPDWFTSGMKSVQKAPSAVNRQPVMFSYNGSAVTASVADITGDGFAFDLGIVKLHFELGVGGGKWAFGNGAAFSFNER